MVIAQIYSQLLGTITVSQNDTISTAIAAVWTILILIYFIETIEHKSTFGIFTTVGRWMLLFTFGLGYGTYAIARLTQVIGRFQFLILTWLGVT